MFDYKKFLDEYMGCLPGKGSLKIHYCGEEEIDIFGTKKDLLYFASRILQFADNDDSECEFAETNLDATIDYEGNVRRVCIFLDNQL